MRTDPLSEAASRRHELTRARAIQALHELDRAGVPVTFAGVARAAGFSLRKTIIDIDRLMSRFPGRMADGSEQELNVLVVDPRKGVPEIKPYILLPMLAVILSIRCSPHRGCCSVPRSATAAAQSTRPWAARRGCRGGR